MPHIGNNLEAVGNPKIPISCEHCDKVYQTSAGLWKHNNMHHNEKTQKKVNDGLSCKHCNLKFNS